MKHILFISHSRGIHGSETVMVQVIRACAAQGTRVTVAVPSIARKEGLDEVLQSIPGVTVRALPYRSAGVHCIRTLLVRLYNLRALGQLRRLVQRETVDTIYSNTSVTILGADLAALTGVRHVWHWHEAADARVGWHPSLQGLYRRKAQQADTIICISRQQQQEWEQALAMPLTNVRVVYNPIKRICPLKSEEADTHTDVRIGFIGHFEPLKNIGMLVHCFESLHAQYPATSLWLCGAMNEQDCAYVETMTDLREPALHILPQTNHVEIFYHAIDILVLPSWCETMPLVVMEAMQAGVCVLQTNRSGMKERIEDGKESLFFSPYEPDTLLRLLQRCMDPDERQQIASAGQKKVMQLIQNESFDKEIQDILCV